MPMPEWSHDNEDALVEMYQERPCLYEINSPDYTDMTLKSAAITEIAKSLNMTGGYRC